MIRSQVFLCILAGCYFFFTSASWAETVQFNYDDLNQVVSATYEDGSSISFNYDAAGNRSFYNVSPATDSDGDGLSDHLENLAGTLPDNPDSDRDGLLDGEEDTNRNGWKDAGETMSLNSDTDGDGMDDGWEVTYSLDPLLNDADLDTDGDGYTNIEEYASGSNPQDISSVPASATPVPAVSTIGLLITLVLLGIFGWIRLGVFRRTAIILLPFILLVTGSGINAHAADEILSLPGIQQFSADPVSPEEAHKIIPVPTSPERAATVQGIVSMAFASTATDDIQAMARSLKYDVDLIYEYVHDKIAYTPIWGSIKGADATLADGIGNSFDQSSLMIALLRASGHTANYKYGTLRLTWDEVSTWLGISSVDGLNILSNGGVPLKKWVYSDGSFAFVDIDHVWIEVEIDGTNYVFDPSYKTHTIKQPINLSTAMGYDRTTFLANSKNGAVEGANYLQNVNKAAIANDLSTYAGNLIQEIKTNHGGATLEDIVGGLEIEPADDAIRQTSLPYVNNETILATWTEIPNSYRTHFTIQHEGIDALLYTDETYGKRLSLFYNSSNQPVLTRDGAVIATGSVTTPDNSADITIIVDHPYAANNGTYQDDTNTFSILTGGSYNIVNGWAETTRGMVEKHRKALNQYKADGEAETSEKVLGETLAMMGFAWLAEVQMSDKLMDNMFKTHTTHHHVIGVCGQNQSPYIDLPIGRVSTLSLEGDSETASASFFASSGRSSAMEWGVIEQFQPNSAVCTVKLLDLANEQGDKIFEATSSNWSSIQPQLTNYSASELSQVQAYINAGYQVIVPQDGNLTQGDWQGIGFLAVSSTGNGIGHIISGGLKGGFGDTTYDADSNETTGNANEGSSSTTNDVSDEPIDLVTGDYLYDHTDLTLGNGPQPFAMAFDRSYNSSNRLADGPLGLGWTHKYDIRTVVDNDGFTGLGERSPIDAAAVIAEIYVTMDLLTESRADDRLIIASIGHRWFMDQLIENVVSVNFPGNTKRFIKLADGSFNPPPGDASELTLTSGAYLLTTKHGIEMSFDTDGRIAAWIDLNGNTLSFSYASDALQSVSNGMSKTFTLSYDNGRISQITDGTGRSISYHYDTDGNLERVTDARGYDTVFQYDIPGRLIRIFFPDKPAIPFVINTYGLDDKVITQTDANGNDWQYYISGYRTEEVNPLGHGNVAYYDKNGKATRRIDPLNNEIKLAYDGHHRLVKETKPEGNYTEYEYDARHNPVRVTQYPKPGSSDAPLVNQFSYDSVFNKLLTSTDPKDRAITFKYDTYGNLERMEQPEVEGVVPVTRMTYNSRGQVLTKTDAEGRITRNTYDPSTGDRLSVITDDGGLNLTSRFSYDNAGNIQTQTDPEGNTTTYIFNNLRLVEQETGPAPFNYIKEYDYDEQGRLIESRFQTGDGTTPWQTRSVTYTNTGKEHIITDPESNQTVNEYDLADRLWKVTNAEAQTTEYIYDAASRIFQVIDAKLQLAQETTYTANGFKATVKDANTNITQYQYDGFDRLDRVIFPDTSYESYSWDEVGNLLGKRTRAGDNISYGYNVLNQLTSKILPGSQAVSYTYDLTGLQKDVTDSRGTIRHDYDDAMRLVTVQYPDGKTIGYQYDDNGNQVRLTYPDSTYVTSQYDQLNRPTDIYQNGATLLAHYDYDPLSRRTTLTYGNGSTASYGYQIDNDLETLNLGHSTGSVNYTYTTDNIGVRTHIYVDDYRFLYRPGQAINANYSLNNLNQYASVGGVTYGYDGNGNLTSDGINTYTYDAENRLISTQTPSLTATYAYDPMGRRIEKNAGGSITKYLHDGNEVLLEYDGTNSELRRYIYGPGIDEPICMITGSNTYYYQFNGQGSVVALSDDSGALQEIYAYSAFGEPNGDSHIGNPYLYNARQYDPETGLYYNRARYYNPRIGRFLQPDPIGYGDGLNLYAYVGNNPMLFFDPYGLSALTRGLDWTQGGLDAIGVFDPTPIADGISGVISLFRGDYVGATASGISMFPYVGDLIGKGGKYGLKYGDEVVAVANKTSKSAAKKGIYEFTDTTGKKYVGQSGNIPNRLKQHVTSGKLEPGTSVKTTEVTGGKTAREIAEHKRIQDITGGVPARRSNAVSNKVDPIGPKRSHLLNE